MRKLKRDDSTKSLLRDEDIRPSLLRELDAAIWQNDIYSIDKFCLKQEAELLEIKPFNENILNIIKNKLSSSGLSLGMTEEELSAYEDAEYYERHPEEEKDYHLNIVSDRPSPHTDSILPEIKVKQPSGFSFEELAIMMQGSPISTKEKTDKPVQLTYSLGQRVVRHYDKKWRKEMRKQLTELSLHRIDVNDIEFFKLHIFRTFYSEQPWYVKMLKSKEERITMAKNDTERMCNDYIEMLIDKSVNKRTEDFENNLSSLWLENWKKYMKELDNLNSAAL